MFKASKQLVLKINSGNSHSEAGRCTLSHTMSNSSSCNNNGGGGNGTNSGDHIENDCVFGKYQQTPDTDQYPCHEPLVFVAPELTDTSKIQLLHFPSGVVKIGSEVNFTIKRNGVKGNFEVKLETPSGSLSPVTIKTVDPERIGVSLKLTQGGLYKVHIKCNSVDLPKSPYIIASICGNTMSKGKVEIPVFNSDASKVVSRGLGLSYLCLTEKNEFTVDGSEAGDNLLFVGIFGIQGQCDEIVVKTMGKSLYKVTYEVADPGDYVLVVKWGDDHIPGSPFSLSAM